MVFFFCNRMVAYAAKFSKKSYFMLIIVKYNMYVPITYLFAKSLAVAQPNKGQNRPSFILLHLFISISISKIQQTKIAVTKI